MENHTTTGEQTLDQALKGLVLGVLAWLAVKYEIPETIIVPATAVVAALLAWASSRVGKDRATASFFGPVHDGPSLFEDE
jgi:hypothetical protein